MSRIIYDCLYISYLDKMLETKHNCPIMFKDIDSNDQLMFCLESKTCIPCPMNDVENRVLFCSNIIIKCLTNVSQCCVFVFMAIVYLFVYLKSTIWVSSISF